jgi:hypothetical protein
VRASSRSKSLSWLSQFQLSQSKPANISNILTGWALAPTSTTPLGFGLNDGHNTMGHTMGEAYTC